MILHIVARADWESALARGLYVPPSLDAEGFIHCSTSAQILRTANRFYRGQAGLIILCIDESRLDAAPLYSYRELAFAVRPYLAPDCELASYHHQVQALPFYTERREVLVGYRGELAPRGPGRLFLDTCKEMLQGVAGVDFEAALAVRAMGSGWLPPG